MLRAVLASSVIHLLSLCFAEYGVAGTVGWIADQLALGWEFLLALLLALLAFLIWLLFGAATLATMGPAAAAVLIVAAVSALGLVERASARNVAATVPEQKPLEVALVPEPTPPETPAGDERGSARAIPRPAPPPAQQMISASVGSSEKEGMKKAGDTVKGKLWTVRLPAVSVSAAEKAAEDGLTRRRQTGADEAATARGAAETSPTDAAEAAEAGENDPARDAADAEDASARAAAEDGRRIRKIFDRLAEAMPRLAGFRTRLNASAREASDPTRREASPEREAAAARILARAEEGYAHAQFAAAEMLLESPRGPADLARARKMLERAALGGYQPAQILLAMVQGEGLDGKAPDRARAHAWLSVAAEQGNPAAARAREALAREFRDGDAVKARTSARKLKSVMSLVAPAAGSGGEQARLNEQLRYAAVLGDSEAVHVLLARNADADDADEEGRTPLIEAAWRGYAGIVQALLDAGARLDGTDDTGKDAVAWAAINGHPDVIRLLAAAGAPVDAMDGEGFTPLMRAAWNGHADAVAALVAGGARTDQRNRFGRTAGDYAKEHRNAAVLRALALAR